MFSCYFSIAKDKVNEARFIIVGDSIDELKLSVQNLTIAIKEQHARHQLLLEKYEALRKSLENSTGATPIIAPVPAQEEDTEEY